MSQKKSKSRKMNRKMSKTVGARKKLSRAIALGISEPKLRGQRSGNVVALAREDRPLRAVEDRPVEVAPVEVATETKTPSPLPLSEIMLCCSPWNVMLRQQAFVVQALSNMMRAQQQFARMLS